MINIFDKITKQLSDAEANYEMLLVTAPDMRAEQLAIELFRREHAALKCQREAEFTALQISARALADAGATVMRLTRALAREEARAEAHVRREAREEARAEVTQAAKTRREAKAQEKMDEEFKQERDAAAYEAIYQKALREQPNALQERADREAAAELRKQL